MCGPGRTSPREGRRQRGVRRVSGSLPRGGCCGQADQHAGFSGLVTAQFHSEAEQAQKIQEAGARRAWELGLNLASS